MSFLDLKNVRMAELIKNHFENTFFWYFLRDSMCSLALDLITFLFDEQIMASRSLVDVSNLLCFNKYIKMGFPLMLLDDMIHTSLDSPRALPQARFQ